MLTLLHTYHKSKREGMNAVVKGSEMRKSECVVVIHIYDKHMSDGCIPTPREHNTHTMQLYKKSTQIFSHICEFVRKSIIYVAPILTKLVYISMGGFL